MILPLVPCPFQWGVPVTGPMSIGGGYPSPRCGGGEVPQSWGTNLARTGWGTPARSGVRYHLARMGYPPPGQDRNGKPPPPPLFRTGWGTPSPPRERTAERVLATWLVVCLLRSRRKTVFSVNYLQYQSTWKWLIKKTITIVSQHTTMNVFMLKYDKV